MFPAGTGALAERGGRVAFAIGPDGEWQQILIPEAAESADVAGTYDEEVWEESNVGKLRRKPRLPGAEALPPPPPGSYNTNVWEEDVEGGLRRTGSVAAELMLVRTGTSYDEIEWEEDGLGGLRRRQPIERERRPPPVSSYNPAVWEEVGVAALRRLPGAEVLPPPVGSFNTDVWKEDEEGGLRRTWNELVDLRSPAAAGSYDEEAWEEVAVGRLRRRSRLPQAARLPGYVWEDDGAGGRSRRRGTCVGPSGSQTRWSASPLPHAMRMPEPSAEALVAAQQGGKVSFELSEDGASWVEKIGNLLHVSRLPPPQLPSLTVEALSAAARGGAVEFALSSDGSWIESVCAAEAGNRVSGGDSGGSQARGAAALMPAARRFPKPSAEAVAAAQSGGHVVFELGANGAWIEAVAPSAAIGGCDSNPADSVGLRPARSAAHPSHGLGTGRSGGMTRRSSRFAGCEAAMPVVARFPPPSSQAIAAAQKGGRVEFVLSADGVSWDALPVTADLATASSEAAQPMHPARPRPPPPAWSRERCQQGWCRLRRCGCG